MEYTFIDKDNVQIIGEIYKRLRTIDGKYTKENRSKYMRAWRAKQKFINVIK